MNQLINYIPLIPFIGLLFAFLPANKNEKAIFYTTVATIILHFLGVLIVVGDYLAAGVKPMVSDPWHIYTSGTSDFSIRFFLDHFSIAYSLVSSVITLLVCVFSRYYIHREKGFKRFFNNILFFYGGLQMILLAGNFETLFIGWEIVGVTSFFLICFYRDRYLPVKNSLKVFSVYRVADVALLLGMWLSHHIHHQSIAFEDLQALAVKNVHATQQASFISFILPFVFLLAAMVKSAQFPFSSWLPRAMEGPTSSSAVFYGSLSIHIGVFLLIRIYPMWHENLTFKVTLILVGLITSLLATSIARVQSTVKTQIAYASITQIGLMLIEVALGWHWIAMIHFMANAFLRCYQLLVSPSVLSYKIHDQFFNFIQPQHNFPNTFWGKIKMTIFVASIKEWNMDTMMYRFLWKSLKSVGYFLHKILSSSIIYIVFIPILVVLVYLSYYIDLIPLGLLRFMPEILSLISLVLILTAFVERGIAYKSLLLVILSQLYMACSISFNEHIDFNQISLYLSGIILCGVIAFLCLLNLQQKGERIDLDSYHGLSWIYPSTSFIFVTACLGLAGFPITPTFIGEDLLLGHIHENQLPLTLLTALNLILDGLVVFRIYARLFLGPHERGEVAFRSS